MCTEDHCVVVIPVYRNRLDKSEFHSLRQCANVLSKYPRVAVASKTLDLPPGFDKLGFQFVERFDDQYFSSIEGYNRLLLSEGFYRRFADFDYILVHQLDAFVFKDELRDWCQKGYDYIGAPWFPGHEQEYCGEEPEPDAVGNGGLSLRSTAGALRILRRWRILKGPLSLWREYKQMGRAAALARVLGRSLGYHNNTRYFIRSYAANEDIFWGKVAPEWDPSFDVPTIDEALRFAFECDPRYWYRRNNQALPFGCHAWLKYDYEFWKPFVGFDLNACSHSKPRSVESC